MPILLHQAKEFLVPEVKEKITEYMDKAVASKVISYSFTGDEIMIVANDLSNDSILSLGVILGLCIAMGMHDSLNKK